MIRAYYKAYVRGIFLQSNEHEFVVHDSWSAVVDSKLRRLKLYSTTKMLSLEDMIDDTLQEGVGFDHPWEAAGKVPRHLKNQAKSLCWIESDWSQALDEFELIREESIRREHRETWQIANGPDKGCCVNLWKGEDRVELNGSIYEKRGNSLIYIGLFEPQIC